jgi:hypothetical protein
VESPSTHVSRLGISPLLWLSARAVLVIGLRAIVIVGLRAIVNVDLHAILFVGFRNLPVQGRFCQNF